MIFKKIKKHFLIFTRRLNQKNEIQKIKECRNNTLDIILESFLAVKIEKFDDQDRKSFCKCENYRSKLLSDESVISYKIFGSERTASVKDICKSAASGVRWCQFLYLISKKVESPIVLEIGTNLGVSGSYILESLKNRESSKFITMEGLPQLCEISSKQFSSIVSTSKFEVKQGLYDDTFPKLMVEDVRFNVLFIDGNHKKEPTINYFKNLKGKVNLPAIFIFDDINWSLEMKEAWEFIKDDQDVNYSIDLYEQGIVILDNNDSKRNLNFSLHLAY